MYRKLDQFYTKESVADKCISFVLNTIPNEQRIQFLEPSAGTGSFSSRLKNCVTVDLDPKIPNCIIGNFLETTSDILGLLGPSEVCVVGNPPFGKCSSLAVKFFNHAAKMANTICFILPKTFKKQSIKNRLDLNFHLIFEWDLPSKSFIFNGLEHNVPCVFQIWIRKEEKRPIQKKVESRLFSFVKKNEAEAAIRRVGGRTGKAFKDISSAAEVSHYFIKSKGLPISQIIEIINKIDFSKIICSTAGVKSLSKAELINEIDAFIEKENINV